MACQPKLSSAPYFPMEVEERVILLRMIATSALALLLSVVHTSVLSAKGATTNIFLHPDGYARRVSR
jgi:hypothetical protein